MQTRRLSRLWVTLSALTLSMGLLVATPGIATAAQAPILYGYSWDQDLLRIDTTTGVATSLGNMGKTSAEIECDPTGGPTDCYLMEFFGPIRQFDRTTATFTGVTSTPSPAGLTFQGLEYVGGTLYGTSSFTGLGSPSSLATVDPLTGAISTIGATGFGPISGLAYSGSVMYGIGGGGPPNLYTIDLGTGVATWVGASGMTNAGSLQFGLDGKLYAGGNLAAPGGSDPSELWTINPATGVGTVVGRTGFAQINGLTMVTDVVAPAVTIATPADGATFGTGSAITASYSCADEAGGSGTASCVGDVVNGGALDTAVGPHTFTVTGTDNAGNIKVVTHNYTVSAQVADTVGLVDITAGIWHLRNSAGVVKTFGFGNPGDLPIAGDWDGNGTVTPGLYRQSDGFFYSRDSNSTGIADAECFAGDAADIPVVGDWDGDGDDNLGIYRPSEQKFYLFTISCANAPMGAAQINLAFGNPGDNPVAGDWDGDGITEIGLHRESTGFFYWRNTLDTGNASDEIFFGDPNDRFVAGDWGIVDGVDTPAIFRPGDLTYYFRHTLTEGNADSQFIWTGAGAGWRPVSGAFGLG